MVRLIEADVLNSFCVWRILKLIILQGIDGLISSFTMHPSLHFLKANVSFKPKKLKNFNNF